MVTSPTMTFDVSTSGFLSTLMSKTIGKALEGYARQTLAGDLAQIAAAAEAVTDS